MHKGTSGCKPYKTKGSTLIIQRSILYYKIPHGWDVFFSDQQGIMDISFIGIGHCICHLHGSHNSHVVLNRHFMHLMWILTICSIDTKRHLCGTDGTENDKGNKSLVARKLARIEGWDVNCYSCNNEIGHQFWIGKVLDMVIHDTQN